MKLLENAIVLSRLILRFGRELRITEDREGIRESDTTHSLMLALLAGELSALEPIQLDRSIVVYLALIHDIAEAYAGDTATLRAPSSELQASKAAKEAEALRQIREELSGFPWILELIDRYEAQSCEESRFVKYLDKILPKLTHRDNGCKVPIETGMSLEEFTERHREQGESLERKYPQFPVTRALFAAACLDAERRWGKE